MSELPDLVIDQGNTTVKWAVFRGGEILKKETTEGFIVPEFVANQSYEGAIYSCVGEAETRWKEHIRANQHLQFDAETPTFLKLDYLTPTTLGVDRIANVCGAYAKKPEEASLIIDVGSCVTLDLVDNNGVYLGGSIAPGLKMRFRSLNTFTANLPLVEPTKPDIPGKSTEESINAGVLHGMTLELRGWLQYFESQYEGLNIWLTGGDASHFAKALESTIFADSNLTLVGLHEVLVHNRI